MTWTRIVRDALVMLGIVGAVVYWWYLTSSGGAPVDVRWYWEADPNQLYPFPELAERNGYNYSPAFEFFIGWSRLLPFEVFVAIWRALLLAVLVFLAGPFTLPVMLLIPVASEINAGNIQILLALAVVLGFRWPATWAFVLLTKVTPGIGLLWFAFRRQWRALAIAIGVTAAIAALSFVMGPQRWFDYFELITSGSQPSVAPYYLPLWTRLPLAFAFVAWGAWTGRKWPVVVGATLALPVYYVISSSMFVGVLPYVRKALGRLIDEGRLPIPRLHPAPDSPA